MAPAFIEFREEGLDSFGFIAVQGEMDCREVVQDGRPGVEFSWEGNDECDPASGRGWACGRGRIAVACNGDSPAEYWSEDDPGEPGPFDLAEVKPLVGRARRDGEVTWHLGR